MIAGMNGVRAFRAQMRRKVGISVKSYSGQTGYTTVVRSCSGEMELSVAAVAVQRKAGS